MPLVPPNTKRKRFLFLILLPLLGLWVAGGWHSHQSYERELGGALHEFTVESKYKTEQIRDRFNSVFRQTYQQLRTIGRLPGVRDLAYQDQSIDFHGGGSAFDADARHTIQEIYNNLASSTDVSEVYIVPVDLDPDHKDKSGARPHEPTITFDQLIVGQHADRDESDTHEEVELEEIEIFEYRLMEKQLATLKHLFPTEGEIEGLAYPAICGPEVVTCDNRFFSLTNPDDRARSGLIYSVPYYNDQGDLSGMVSGVILTYVLRDMIQTGDFVLINPTYNYTVTPKHEGAWRGRESSWRAAAKDDTLLYSQVMPIAGLNDIDSSWYVWSGIEDHVFWNRTDVKAIGQMAIIRQVLIATVILVLGIITFTVWHMHNTLVQKNIELEQRVEEQTRDLLAASRQAGMAEIATGVIHNVGNVLNSVNVSSRMIEQTLAGSRLQSLGKLVDIIDEQKDRLDAFVSDDPRGQCLPEFLKQLHTTLRDEHADVRKEIDELIAGIDHIKEIVNVQQKSAAESSNLLELSDPAELMDQAVKVNLLAMERHHIELVCEYEPDLQPIRVDKHKVLQILINLISNAKKATCHPSVVDRIITLKIKWTGSSICFEVHDNGVGIEADKLDEVFRHGYSQFKGGHGFGLHSGACAAKELGATLSVNSPGTGLGAVFVLSIPKHNTQTTSLVTEAA